MIINDADRTIWCDECKEWKSLYEVYSHGGADYRLLDLRHHHVLGYTFDSAYRLLIPAWSIDD